MEEKYIEPELIGWSKQAEIALAGFDLVQRHMAWATTVALSLYKRYSFSTLEAGDFINHAMIGLIESASRFEASKSVNFRAYAGRRIHGAILNNISKYSEKDELYQFQKRRLDDSLKAIYAEHKEESVEARLINTILDLAVVCFLDEDLDHQTIQHQCTFGFEKQEIPLLLSRIKKASFELPDKEKQVLSLHYEQYVEFADISTLMNISKGRVSQLHSNGLRLLRKRLNWE